MAAPRDQTRRGAGALVPTQRTSARLPPATSRGRCALAHSPLPAAPHSAAHSLSRACPGCGLAQLLGAQGAGSSLDQVLRRLRIAANATRLGCEERECSPPPLRAAGLPCRGRHVESCTRSCPRVGAQGCALRAHAAALVAQAVAAAVHHPVPPPGRGRPLLHPG